MPQDPTQSADDSTKDAWPGEASPDVRTRKLPSGVEPHPGRWHHEAPPPPRCRFPISARVRILAAIALVPSFALVVLSPYVAAFVGIGLLFALAFTQSPDDRWAEDRDIGLLENPDDLDVCLVDVQIRRNGKLVGTDRGAAWFEGGRLLFSGHRTSFVLGGQDILPAQDVLPASERSRRPSSETIPLRVRQGEASVRFGALLYGDPQMRHIARFKERLRDFRLAAPRSRGPRQWPPFEA